MSDHHKGDENREVIIRAGLKPGPYVIFFASFVNFVVN